MEHTTEESKFIGCEWESIRLELIEWGVDYRLVRRDTTHFVLTCDFRPERLNIEVDNGIITKVYEG